MRPVGNLRIDIAVIIAADADPLALEQAGPAGIAGHLGIVRAADHVVERRGVGDHHGAGREQANFAEPADELLQNADMVGKGGNSHMRAPHLCEMAFI